MLLLDKRDVKRMSYNILSDVWIKSSSWHWLRFYIINTNKQYHEWLRSSCFPGTSKIMNSIFTDVIYRIDSSENLLLFYDNRLLQYFVMLYFSLFYLSSKWSHISPDTSFIGVKSSINNGMIQITYMENKTTKPRASWFYTCIHGELIKS